MSVASVSAVLLKTVRLQSRPGLPHSPDLYGDGGGRAGQGSLANVTSSLKQQSALRLLGAGMADAVKPATDL